MVKLAFIVFVCVLVKIYFRNSNYSLKITKATFWASFPKCHKEKQVTK